ncbi:MAG: tyrosine--tRNA ligase [Rhodobacteraceae bacterium]|nr:tyrosine--tRNA ligase [Paracoccaceae bacterium]
MTYNPKSEFLNVIRQRGFFNDCSNLEELDNSLMKGIIPAYIGFDATAKSLHIGSLIQIMMLRWLQKTGHKPIVLMGGGTTKVGDPSFRADERPLLDSSEIEANISGIKEVFSSYITFGNNPTDAVMVNNAEWLDNLNYISFLRDIGKYFSVNRMLSFESVKSRLDREQSLSFLEFNYMILQAYDFLELAKRRDCQLQMGGSDQWGNILNGVDLTRRIIGKQVFALTSPLLTTSDGKKMGKTQSGAVWLNANLFSPYDFWQYWRNVSDNDVVKFLKLFTELDLAECDRLGSLEGSEINEAKIILANEVTNLAHGREQAQKAFSTAREVFVERRQSEGLPILSVTSDSLMEDGYPLLQALVQVGLVSSGKEARRNLLGNGVRVNDIVETNTARMLSLEELTKSAKISVGKKRHAIIQLEK